MTTPFKFIYNWDDCQVYTNSKELASKLGVKQDAVLHACSGKAKHAGGAILSYCGFEDRTVEALTGCLRSSITGHAYRGFSDVLVRRDIDDPQEFYKIHREWFLERHPGVWHGRAYGAG